MTKKLIEKLLLQIWTYKLMDIYVEPFYRAIHYANLGSIMAAYNAINNTQCVENKFLLTDILRNILGFKGFVMSDWWGFTAIIRMQ